jgi:tetratricopeptide (TPR) repeat protein
MYMAAKRYGQAADLYGQALDVEPASARLRSGFGIALFYAGLQTMAQKELKKALDLDPNNAESHYNYALAISHGSNADPEAANRSWREVIRLDADGPLGRQAMQMLGPSVQTEVGSAKEGD